MKITTADQFIDKLHKPFIDIIEKAIADATENTLSFTVPKKLPYEVIEAYRNAGWYMFISRSSLDEHDQSHDYLMHPSSED